MTATLTAGPQAALELALVRNQNKPKLENRQIYLLDQAYLLVLSEGDRWLVDCEDPAREELKFIGDKLKWVSASLFDDALPIDVMPKHQFDLLFG